MIKTWVAAAILATAVPVSLAAQETGHAAGMPERTYASHISLWGGYTMVGMGDVNDDLRAFAPAGTVTKVETGYVAAGDFLYEMLPRFFGGLRIEYLGTNQGKASNVLADQTRDFYLIPIMVGGRYYLMGNQGGWNFSGAVFAGVGLAYGKTKTTLPVPAVETKYSGSGFVGDILVGGEYRLSDTVSLGVDLGYRYAPIAQMNIDTSGSGGGGGGGYSPKLRKAAVTGVAGNTLKYDFSGMIANIGINFRY